MRELGIIKDGALLVREGLIVEAGPFRRIENLLAARRAEPIEARGRVAMPGFVDSHTHMVFAQNAASGLDARLEGAPVSVGVPGPEAAIRSIHTTARLLHRTKPRLERMLRHGATTVEVKSGYGLDETGELKILRVANRLREIAGVSPTLLAGQTVPLEYRDESQAYFRYLEEDLLPRVRRRRLARCADLVVDPERFSFEQMRGFLRAAADLRFHLKLHAEETGARDAVALALEFEALSVDHLENCDAAAAAALGRGDTIATLTPGSSFLPGGPPPAPARLLIDSGAPVALATNYSPETSPTYSMQMVLSLACAELRMTPAEAIVAATINGAHALGWADRAGSLEPGKPADILLMNAADYREIPFVFGVNHVHKAIHQGEVVYDEEGGD